MKDDLVHLLSLVALLISTAGFKSELTSIKLGDTDFTLFTVFCIASLIFGALLYVHLLISGGSLFRQAWREKKKVWLVVILRFIFVAMLTIIPLGAIYIGTSNWLYTEQCSHVFVNGDVFDPFALSYDVSDINAQKLVCQAPLFGYIIPGIVTILIPVIVWYFALRSEKKYLKLSAEARRITAEIASLQITQAISSDLEKNRKIRSQIEYLRKKLAAEHDAQLKNK